MCSNKVTKRKKQKIIATKNKILSGFKSLIKKDCKRIFSMELLVKN